MRLDAGEEAGILEVNKATREAVRTWYDTFQRGEIDSANVNLWAEIAVSPPPAELTAFVADFDMLPLMVASMVLSEAGYKMGLDSYPSAPVPAEIQGTNRRKLLGFETPAGTWYLRPSGGGGAYGDELARFAAGKEGASRYEALRALVIARAHTPDAATVAAAIEQYPGIPIVLEDALVEAAGTGGKALSRL
jgi:hypothetical protein